MANVLERVPENVAGAFFVDRSCIDCGTCRHLAPETFREAADHSFVAHQPSDEPSGLRAARALLSCPTGSIGAKPAVNLREAMATLPLDLGGGIWYCGFTSASSFGASSYFIAHPEGNWLVDSPRYLPHLVRFFEENGGLATIFLTHRDDVADTARYASHFHARRVIHRADLEAQPEAELVLEGTEPLELAPGFTVVPVPGHTRGSCALWHDRALFSGDHLWGQPETQELGASRRVCWYSWEEQCRSMERLLGYEFDAVWPGHGAPIRLPALRMRAALEELIGRMRRPL